MHNRYCMITIVLTALTTHHVHATQTSLVARPRGHSGHTASIISNNRDLGSITPEEQELFDKKTNAHVKLLESFFKAAQTGQGLEQFLLLVDFDFNAKNLCDGDKTALMYIAEKGLTDLACKLMEKKALAFTVKDKSGKCAYDYAQGHPELRALMARLQFHDLCRRNSIIKTTTDVCKVLYMGVEIVGPKDEDDEKK